MSTKISKTYSTSFFQNIENGFSRCYYYIKLQGEDMQGKKEIGKTLQTQIDDEPYA